MTFEAALLLVILVVLVYFFLTERLPVDLTALSGLMLLVLLGYVPFEGAFRGFSSSAVITLIGTFFLGAALRVTGVAENTARLVYRIVGDRETLIVAAVMVVGALLSAVMSNVAATAVLLPAVVSLAHRAQISPSRLLIPLAFSTVLGGTSTMIGTMPNILVAELMIENQLKPFQFFDFAPFGFLFVLLGVGYLALFGIRKLPDRDNSRRRRGKRDLKNVYRLRERLFSLRIPRGSALAGKTLSQVHFGRALDAYVVSIIRSGEKVFAPSGDQPLREGDLLLARGRVDELRRLLRFRGARVEPVTSDLVTGVARRFQAKAVAIRDSAHEGAYIRELRLRKKFGVISVAIERNETFFTEGIGEESLQLGDRLHLFGTELQFEQMEKESGFSLSESEVSPDEYLESHAFSLEVLEESPLIGTPLKESQIVGLLDLNLLGLVHSDLESELSSTEAEISVGDRLLMIGQRDTMLSLIQLGELEVESTEVDSEIESKEVGVLEAVLSPRSKLIDKSVRDIGFTDKYGFQVLALWRKGRPIRSRVAREPLQFGDALLLQGPRRKMSVLAQDPDFVVLSEDLRPPARKAKAPVAMGALFITIVMAAFQLVPVHIATFVGATFAALFGAVQMREAYREIEWRVVFVVACLIPIGGAVGDAGLASFAAEGVVKAVGGYGPLVTLIAFSILASFVSQILDSTLSVILLAPITIETAQALGMSPSPLLMAVALSASVAFLTPFSHKANLLVMGAGGYRMQDYLRVGIPMTVICFLTLWAVIPLIYPF